MSTLRNPFMLRDAERIRYAETFLGLFGPGILNVLSKGIPRNLVQIFTSSPGGGKTSLFRLFTPQSLIVLDERKELEDYKELYSRLKGIGAISDDGPNVLGIYLSCNQNYDLLEDLMFEKVQRQRLFFSLLNSRIMIAALRGILTLFHLSYPDDLKRLRFVDSRKFNVYPEIRLPCNGEDLHMWATNNEMSILGSIDSFIPEQEHNVVGHDTLFSLNLLQPESIYIDGKKLKRNVLLMFDDVERLSPAQRETLQRNLLQTRWPISIWLAERLEALSSVELLAPGSRIYREYIEPINLEDYWREKARRRRFESWLAEIADRRTRLARDAANLQISSFEACLTHSRNRRYLEKKYSQALEAVSRRIKERTKETKTYDLWITNVEELKGSNREKAIAWGALEIVIKRRRLRRLFNEPIPAEEMDMDQGIKSIAEFFLSREFGIPYYFGFSRLAQISSYNVEQFIYMAGNLFEEAISSVWLDNRFTLSVKRQEEILRDAAKRIWVEIPRSVPNSNEIISLLNHVKELCLEETFRETSPYNGVTGIGIRRKDIDTLIEAGRIGQNQNYVLLEKVLKTCISQNLFEEIKEYRQGRKGEKWVILYLNRILCVHFGLPLNYGGWRPRRLSALLSCMRRSTRMKEPSLESEFK